MELTIGWWVEQLVESKGLDWFGLFRLIEVLFLADFQLDAKKD